MIGNEGGFLAAPVNMTGDNGKRLLMGLAERADLVVDFTKVPSGITSRERGSGRAVRRRRPGQDFTSPTQRRQVRFCSSASGPQ